VGPYSQAAVTGRTVYCSGQIAIDPATGMLVEGGAGEQARICLQNIEAVLAASGCGMRDVIKTAIFVTDMTEFKAVNEAYAASFPADPPARTTVAVAALPMGAKVEIEAVAIIP